MRGAKLQPALNFFENAEFKRVSFAITDRTVFENGEVPKSPVLELALEHLLHSMAELMTGGAPVEALSIVFEDGPLLEKMRRHWPQRVLTRNDGVRLPVAWAALPKDAAEPGLEIADFIAHSCAGFMRDAKNPNSAFADRYRAIHPAGRPDLSKGLELNKAEFRGWEA